MDYFTPVYGKEDSEIYYSFLYTVYSIPNIILPLYGGVLSDLIGSVIKLKINVKILIFFLKKNNKKKK